MQNKKVAVVLSGCGVFDGSEIFEATLTLLRLDQLNCQVQCFAPDIMQHHVLDHRTGNLMPEHRNVLTEAARINRGNVHSLAEANANDFDALIVPGGFGVAKNLSDFAFANIDCTVQDDFSALVQQFHQQKKPIGMVCIAPTLLPKILGSGISCTIGRDPATAGQIDEMGGLHISCDVDNIVIDHEHKIVTTPAYMEAKRISEAAEGINKLVDKVIELS